VDHGEAASKVEEEGAHALEVGPEAHAAEAPQDQAAKGLVDLVWIFKKGFLTLDIPSNTGLKFEDNQSKNKNCRENMGRQDSR